MNNLVLALVKNGCTGSPKFFFEGKKESFLWGFACSHCYRKEIQEYLDSHPTAVLLVDRKQGEKFENSNTVDAEVHKKEIVRKLIDYNLSFL